MMGPGPKALCFFHLESEENWHFVPGLGEDWVKEMGKRERLLWVWMVKEDPWGKVSG